MEIWKEAEPIRLKGKSGIGVLVLHGFTGSTSSIREWAEGLNAAGHAVIAPRLAGHGTEWRDLNNVKWADWIREAESAYAALSAEAKTVFVAGLSMGGTIALHLALSRPGLPGIILVNQLILLGNPLLPFSPLIRRIVPAVKGVSNDIKAPGKHEAAYNVAPTGGVDEFRKMIEALKPKLPSIKTPVLMFKSREDHVIPARSATWTMERLGSPDKELVWLENSYHVATLDNDSPLIVEKSLTFIDRLAGRTRP